MSISQVTILKMESFPGSCSCLQTPFTVMNNRVNYQETKIIKNFALHAWERRDQIRFTALILQLSAPIYGREFKL